MSEKAINRLVGIILILAAFYSMDFSNWSKTSIFIVLNLAGLSSILKDARSEFYRKLSDVFQKTAFTIAAVLIIKMLFF